MSRLLARRATVLTAAAGCVLAAFGPASAATAPFPVTVTTTGGARQFAVTQTDGQTGIDGFAFGTTLRELPFQVTVADQGVPLAGNNYSVSATMSNMYYKPAGGGTDYSTMIPSHNLGFRYNASDRLRALGLELPVVPQLTLGGTVSCQGMSLLGAVQALLDACSLLGGGKAADTTTSGAQQVLDEVDLAVSGVLDLATLPLALTGAQETGRFTTPAKFDAGDTAVAGTDATAKGIMKGTNLLTGGTLGDAAARIDAALDRHLAGTEARSLITQDQLLTALSQQASLASVVDKLRQVTDTAQVAEVLAGVTAVVNDVTVHQLSVMSGKYSARPLLTVEPVTIRPGAYEGKMTVDFFQE